MAMRRLWTGMMSRRAGITAAPPAPRALPLGMRLRPINWAPHLILLTGVVVLAFPVYMALVGSTHDAAVIQRGEMPLVPGDQIVANYQQAWALGEGARVKAAPVRTMMFNSFVMAMVIAVGKIAISILSAFAVAFFRFPLRMFFFWMIFITLMLPVEVRIIPTYAVVSNLGMINTFQGLTIPLLASATGTLIFRQFFLSVPDELVEAAKIDGAGPIRFFWSVLAPISSSTIAALFVILFVYGWNQYLWPLLITTSPGMETIVIGITKMIGLGEGATDWNLIMATTMLALLPPVLVVIVMQRWFIKGLTATEK
jgi:sn-glycerol 3-phosphate transport system permease protein